MVRELPRGGRAGGDGDERRREGGLISCKAVRRLEDDPGSLQSTDSTSTSLDYLLLFSHLSGL